MSDIPQFRNMLPKLLPWWAQNRPGFQVLYKILWTLAATLDVGVQTLLESVYAWYPGVGTPTALPFLGASRGLLRAEDDTDATYAAYLQTWRDVWDEIASDEALLAQIQRYYANHPVCRIVNRAGKWITVNADGTFALATAPWNWDTLSNPERNTPDAPWWSDIWIVMYAPEWAKRQPSTDGHPWNDPDLGMGLAIPRVARDVLASFISGPAQWKAPHCWVVAVLFTFDTTLFDPANITAPGNPDGWWGDWSKPDGTIARNTSVRYFIPENG